MLELLLEADMNVRLFAGVDVVISITTGRPLLCRFVAVPSIRLYTIPFGD
jgi:hypothetical protein